MNEFLCLTTERRPCISRKAQFSKIFVIWLLLPESLSNDTEVEIGLTAFGRHVEFKVAAILR